MAPSILMRRDAGFDTLLMGHLNVLLHLVYLSRMMVTLWKFLFFISFQRRSASFLGTSVDFSFRFRSGLKKLQPLSLARAARKLLLKC